ncbi:hypothetical protein SBA7_150003 [Candidatus Sulfotelmatobacter sp. SbA7]|nr:hypothetical protein SBA7_150003 [Candidatus Sulfotelmatobacter sp. SbA7]
MQGPWCNGNIALCPSRRCGFKSRRVHSPFFVEDGTEGFNTLLKFANNKKEASKADAADKQAGAGNQKLQLVNKQV